MGRDVPPRVTYWTGTWDPAREAISKEISTLRAGVRARSPLVAYSAGNRTRVALRSGTLTLSARWWPALRLAAGFIEPRGDVSHVFGGGGSWHLLRALGRRPILLTAVVAPGAPDRALYSKCARVVVESEAVIGAWVAAGVSPEAIELVRPAIDLDHYRPAATRSSRFTLLFASSPADPEEIESRGIGLLVELARLNPDMDILVPWRVWGDMERARRDLEARRPPANFVLRVGDVGDMRECYTQAHATIVCFARGVGKTCPHFVLEGFASGLPCLTTREGGLADLVAEREAGVVAHRDVRALSEGLRQLRAGYQRYAARARRLAEDEFDLRRFGAKYEAIYAAVAAGHRSPR
jgi:glycosyltransferase involved in cell wall biosynthesis